MPKLMRVTAQDVLHLPPDMQADQNRIWLKAGGVIDMDDPFTRHAVKGQEYKLEDAPEGAEVTALKDGRLLNYREQWNEARKKRRAARRQAIVADRDPDESEDEEVDTEDAGEDDDDADDASNKETATATAGGNIQKPDKNPRARKTKE